MNFLASRRASKKPSATSMISQISSKSGTTIAQGLQGVSRSARPLPPGLHSAALRGAGDTQRCWSRCQGWTGLPAPSPPLSQTSGPAPAPSTLLWGSPCTLPAPVPGGTPLWEDSPEVGICSVGGPGRLGPLCPGPPSAPGLPSPDSARLCSSPARLPLPHTPEQGLQVLGQLRAPRVPGIHGDEDADSGDEADDLPQEVEGLLFGPNGILDALDLGSGRRWWAWGRAASCV